MFSLKCLTKKFNKQTLNEVKVRVLFVMPQLFTSVATALLLNGCCFHYVCFYMLFGVDRISFNLFIRAVRAELIGAKSKTLHRMFSNQISAVQANSKQASIFVDKFFVWSSLC